MDPVHADDAGHPDVRERAGEELARTLFVIDEARAITAALATPPGQLLDARTDARTRLSRLAHRPMDLALARVILTRAGVWQSLDNQPTEVPTSPLEIGACTDDGPLARLARGSKHQAEQTGWSNDIGTWQPAVAFSEIRAGGTDRLTGVAHQIMSADPDGRAAVLHQLLRAGLFATMFEAVPWHYTKAIHDGLPRGHGDLKSALQPYFLVAGKWGTDLGARDDHTPSLDRMLDEKAETTGGLPGKAIGAAGSIFNFLTLGFARTYGQTTDAHNDGLISDDDHAAAMRQVATRTAVQMAFMMTTAGLARGAAMAPLPNLAMQGAAPTAGSVALEAGIGAATMGTAEMIALDAGDVASGAKAEFSSISDYLVGAILSGGMAAGSALLARWLSGRSAKYLDSNQRTRAQQLQVEDPILTPVLDQMKGARPGDTVRLRITYDEAYALHEAGLIDANAHRSLRTQLATMPEVEAEVHVLKGLDLEPARGPGGQLPIHDAPSLNVRSIGPIAANAPALVRMPRPRSQLLTMIPEGGQLSEVGPNDAWVSYVDKRGKSRVLFRADQATIWAERPTPLRNDSTERRAAMTEDGRVVILEGVHRGVGSAHGDVIPSNGGGIKGEPGALDYPLRDFTVPNGEVRPTQSVSIDYNQPDTSMEQADAVRATRSK